MSRENRAKRGITFRATHTRGRTMSRVSPSRCGAEEAVAFGFFMAAVLYRLTVKHFTSVFWILSPSLLKIEF